MMADLALLFHWTLEAMWKMDVRELADWHSRARDLAKRLYGR